MSFEGLKDFFRFTKTKLYITIGLFVFSLVLGFIAIEGHLFFLVPIYKYLFNWADLFDLANIPWFFGVTLFFIVWVLQMYLYSCIIMSIKSGSDFSKPTKVKLAITLAIFVIVNVLLLVIQSGCPEGVLICPKEDSRIQGGMWVIEGATDIPEQQKDIFTEKAMPVPLTCRQVCTKSEYYQILMDLVIVKKLLLPLILGYLLSWLIVYFKDNPGELKDFMKKDKKILVIILVIILVGTAIWAGFYIDNMRNNKAFLRAMDAMGADLEEGVKLCDEIRKDQHVSGCYMTYLGMKLGKIEIKYTDAYGDSLSDKIKQQKEEEKKAEIDRVCGILKVNKYGAKSCEMMRDAQMRSEATGVITLIKTCKKKPAESQFYVPKGSPAIRYSNISSYRFFVVDVGQLYCIVDISNGDTLLEGGYSNIIYNGSGENVYIGPNAKRMNTSELFGLDDFQVKVFDASPGDEVCGLEIVGAELEECVR